MPFTISHVAAVLPFCRPLTRWGLLSATIIGSMVPDFGFLMPWRPARIETHSVVGLVTFCLPVGLTTFWIFQLLVKTAVMETLPDAAYGRWREFAKPADIGHMRQWLLAAIGVLAGAVTHLIWDAFTHEGARGVRMFPALDDPIVEIAGRQLMGARLLQDVSSLIGFALVLIVIAYALRPSGDRNAEPARMLSAAERSAWTMGFLIMAVILAVWLFSAHRVVYGPSLGFLIAGYAIAALRGVAGSLLLVSLAVTFRLSADR